MRVTGGVLGSRSLMVPRSGVRPTQDRVRAALFSILANRIPGCRFLDLFAGSGAVGLDAWSRGAAVVWWVESHPRVLAVLRANVAALCGGDRAKVCGMDAIRFVKECPAGAPFDVIYCDPPYGRGSDAGRVPAVMRLLDVSNVLAVNGIVVVEQASDEPDACCEGWVKADERRYGGTRIGFLVRSRSMEAGDEQVGDIPRNV
jgi:16S rRNA (guanine966-N2)-methyltransferase